MNSKPQVGEVIGDLTIVEVGTTTVRCQCKCGRHRRLAYYERPDGIRLPTDLGQQHGTACWWCDPKAVRPIRASNGLLA
jgi:hypothetical protein